jgi:uncharacterized protein (TIGR03382 family)
MRKGPLSVLSILLFASNAHAAVESYVAALDGVQEVPPNGTAANGQATLSLDTATSKLSGTITVSKLQGTSEVSVMVENAACGATPTLPPTLTFDPPNAQGTITVSASLDAAQIAALRAKTLNINVHTSSVQSGEIRGQIYPAGGSDRCPASAPAKELYVAELTPSQVVPPASVAGHGTALLTYEPATHKLTGTVDSDQASSLTQFGQGACGSVDEQRTPDYFTPADPSGHVDVDFDFLAPDEPALRGGMFFIQLQNASHDDLLRGQVYPATNKQTCAAPPSDAGSTPEGGPDAGARDDAGSAGEDASTPDAAAGGGSGGGGTGGCAASPSAPGGWTALAAAIVAVGLGRRRRVTCGRARAPGRSCSRSSA